MTKGIRLRVYGAFDGKNQMLYTDPMLIFDNCIAFDYPGFSHLDSEEYNTHIMESAEVTVKNGDVWVGDILRLWSGLPVAVIKYRGAIGWRYPEGEFVAIGQFHDTFWRQYAPQITIIGNIHESPELIP